MGSSAQRFYDRVKPLIMKDRDLPDFFAYHVTVEMAQPLATIKSIRECYEACDLVPPSWLASHFSNGLQKPRRFIKLDGGYRLENRRRQEICSLIGEETQKLEISFTLDRLETQIEDGIEKDFLHETISCFGIGAYRAALVMCWNLVLYHLQKHILLDQIKLIAFNEVLAKNTDTRVKIKAINQLDSFTEMSENKFLLFCREAKLINSSLFNKLNNRLDERNAAAHPSGVKITPRVAEAYIEDLVENVLKKFQISGAI